MNPVILFDLGNTIVDYHKGELSDDEKEILGLWNLHVALKELNTFISFDDLYSNFYQPWRHVLPNRAQQQTEFDIKPFLSKVVNIEHFTASQYEKLIIQFFEPFSRFAVASSGISKTLGMLKDRNYQIGIISNTPLPGYCHDLTLKNLNLLSFFDFRLYSYDFGARKPNSEIFEEALSCSKCSPDEVVMIGDSFNLDVNPALELGFNAILYSGIKKQNNKSYKCKQISTWEGLFPVINTLFIN